MRQSSAKKGAPDLACPTLVMGYPSGLLTGVSEVRYEREFLKWLKESCASSRRFDDATLSVGRLIFEHGSDRLHKEQQRFLHLFLQPPLRKNKSAFELRDPFVRRINKSTDKTVGSDNAKASKPTI